MIHLASPTLTVAYSIRPSRPLAKREVIHMVSVRPYVRKTKARKGAPGLPKTKTSYKATWELGGSLNSQALITFGHNCVKIMITTGCDWSLAKWINMLVHYKRFILTHIFLQWSSFYLEKQKYTNWYKICTFKQPLFHLPDSVVCQWLLWLLHRHP